LKQKPHKAQELRQMGTLGLISPTFSSRRENWKPESKKAAYQLDFISLWGHWSGQVSTGSDREAAGEKRTSEQTQRVAFVGKVGRQ
jgi:hypothetical protein